jgi:hypothetical protein
LLALASRLARDPDAFYLATVALGFLERAHRKGSDFRLRQRGSGAWTEDPPSDDAAGRALFGLGTAAAHAPWPDLQRRALALFEAASILRTSHLRAVAHAALGAVEVLRVLPESAGARRLVDAAACLSPSEGQSSAWPWPESRLSYANALLPDASLSVALVNGDLPLASRALDQMRWLVERQTVNGHFSFTPVGGCEPSARPPLFDQQPIEAWAMASAGATAFAYTRDPWWAAVVQRAAAWFLGDNDVGVVVFDALTGGGYDGLTSNGVNRNEGAESSMAFVGTMLHLDELAQQLDATMSE